MAHRRRRLAGPCPPGGVAVTPRACSSLAGFCLAALACAVPAPPAAAQDRDAPRTVAATGTCTAESSCASISTEWCDYFRCSVGGPYSCSETGTE